MISSVGSNKNRLARVLGQEVGYVRKERAGGVAFTNDRNLGVGFDDLCGLRLILGHKMLVTRASGRARERSGPP